MVKEHTLFLMETSLRGNGRKGNKMREHHTWSDGYKYVGSWKRGQMWNGIYYDNKGNIFGKQVNGVQQ